MIKNKISKDRKDYLQKQKRNKVLIYLTQISLLVVLLISWELLAKYNIIDSFMTSSPSGIMETLFSFNNREILNHIFVTVYETVIGFVLGTLIGILIAIILWYSKFISKVLDPYLVILNSLPKVALGPIIILWVGAGTEAIIVMAIAISLIVTVLENLNGFLNTDKNLIKMAKTFNANKIEILTKIVIPSNISTFISSLKVNIGLSLVGVISGEFLVSKAGLGYLIVYGGQVFQLDLVMTSIILLGLIAGVMYISVIGLEKFILKIKKFK